MAEHDDKRGTMVSVRFPKDEYEAVRQTAERTGSSISSVIRDTVLRANEYAPRSEIVIGSCNGSGTTTGITASVGEPGEFENFENAMKVILSVPKPD